MVSQGLSQSWASLASLGFVCNREERQLGKKDCLLGLPSAQEKDSLPQGRPPGNLLPHGCFPSDNAFYAWLFFVMRLHGLWGTWKKSPFEKLWCICSPVKNTFIIKSYRQGQRAEMGFSSPSVSLPSFLLSIYLFHKTFLQWPQRWTCFHSGHLTYSPGYCI